jgi:hypothetical protein
MYPECTVDFQCIHPKYIASPAMAIVTICATNALEDSDVDRLKLTVWRKYGERRSILTLSIVLV